MANQPGSENLSQEITWITTEANPLLTMYVNSNPHRQTPKELYNFKNSSVDEHSKPRPISQLGGLGLPGGPTSILRTK